MNDTKKKILLRTLAACPAGKYPLWDNLALCYFPTDSVPLYYYDSTSLNFKSCKTECQTCMNGTSCITCKTSSDYYPKSDQTTSCYLRSSTLNGYYFDIRSLNFRPCDISCLNCSTSSTYCSDCKINYFSVQNQPGLCKLSNSLLSGYYFDNLSQSFKLCDVSCSNCSTSPINCSNCNANFYPVQNQPGVCRQSNSVIAGYYFDNPSQSFKLCDLSCVGCTTNMLNCDRCNEFGGFFALEDNPRSCFMGPPATNGYFFDFGGKIFRKCDGSCAKCNGGPNICIECSIDYYAIEGTNYPCINSKVRPVGFYLDHTGSVILYKKCHQLCSYCIQKSDLKTQYCSSCISGYYKMIGDDYNCYAPQDYYFVDSDNILKSCYFSCQTCSGPGTDYDHKCIKCKSGYYFISGKKNCMTGSVFSYFLDTTKSLYIPCYGGCAYCWAAGDMSNQYCYSCKDGFYNLEDNKYVCYIKTEQIPYYYFKNTTNSTSTTIISTGYFAKCYTSCKICTLLGNQNQNFCLTCREGYYKSHDNIYNCYSNLDKNYLAIVEGSNEKMFYPCYEGCLYCNRPASSDSHNCLSCDNSNKYYASEKNSSNCYKADDSPTGYFYSYDLNSFTKCPQLKNQDISNLSLVNNNINGNITNIPNSNYDYNKTLKIVSIIPNFIDLTSRTSIDIKFSNYLSNNNSELKIVDVYISATLSTGMQMHYGLAIRGFDCDVLHTEYFPVLNINSSAKKLNKKTVLLDLGVKKDKSSKYIYNNRSSRNLLEAGEFKIFVVNAKNNTISADAKELNILMSENQLPSFLKAATEDIESSFQSYIKYNDIKQNLISKNTKNQTIQIFNASIVSMEFSYKLAIQNSLAIFNVNSCIKKIIQYYNTQYKLYNYTGTLTEEDIILLKIDDQPKVINPFSNYNGYRTRIFFFNTFSITKEEINYSTICEKETISILIPVNSGYPHFSPVNITKANYFYAFYKSDILNENDRIYTDICYNYYDDSTDFTVNDRRQEIFQKIKISCGTSCNFKGFDSYSNFITCECNASDISNSLMLNYFTTQLEDLKITNLNLFSCFIDVFFKNKIENNYGFFFGIGLLFIVFLNFFIFMILPDLIEKKIWNEESQFNICKNGSFNNKKNETLQDKYYNEIYMQASIGDENDMKPNISQKKSISDNNNYLYEINFYNTSQIISKRKNPDDVNAKIDLHVTNLNRLKKLIDSDACYFYPIEDKVKNKLIKEFYKQMNKDKNEKDKNKRNDDSIIFYENKINDDILIQANKQQNKDVKKKSRKYKIRINIKRNKKKEKSKNYSKKEIEVKNYLNNNQIRYYLKQNKRRIITHIKAKFIKSQNLLNSNILNAEADLNSFDLKKVKEGNDLYLNL